MLSMVDLHAQLDESLAINSVESSFSYEFYTDLINEQRSLWLRNEYNKNRTIDPYVIQSLSCVPMELVDPIQCCVTVPNGCKVLRSVSQIPNTIEFFYTKGIASVGPADITRPRFILVDYSRVPYVGNGRTNQNSIYAFIYDQYIYLISRGPNVNLITNITIRGIFEDPTSLANFLDCSGGSCYSIDDPYPLNLWMWAYIKPYVLQQLMQKGTNALDDANNAEDGKTEGGIPSPNSR
jgi:hypothetical protein